ncbi:MAG: hypothetical protein Q8Q35_01975 [Nanoarchaeota archaeon]|nr:hypothetical protein [Nanoarchaeota archaeon]
MATTIQVSEELRERLALRKSDDKESYEEIIWDLLEDTMELSAQTKKDIALARKEYKQGKFVTHAQLKKGLGF